MRLNPIDWLSSRSIPHDHISYDPEHADQYYRVATSTHDGTLLFTERLIGKLLLLLVNRQSFYKPALPHPIGEVMSQISYVVGDLRLASVYGNYEINGHMMYGERQRARLQVRCILPTL